MTKKLIFIFGFLIAIYGFLFFLSLSIYPIYKFLNYKSLFFDNFEINYYVYSVVIFIFLLSVLNLINFIKRKSQFLNIFIIFFLSLTLISEILINSNNFLYYLKKKEFKQNKIQFDEKAPKNKLNELRITNNNINFQLSTWNFREDFFNNLKIHPLSNIPNSMILSCNENGYYPTYVTDKLGFNNKPLENNNIDLIVIGDSFANGECVNQDDNISSKLRKNHSINAINIGLGGSGPLEYLAYAVEYVPFIKPKRSIVLFYEGNDIFHDLEFSKNSILNEYINDNYQNILKNHGYFLEKTNEYLALKTNKENFNFNKNILIGKIQIRNLYIKKKIILSKEKIIKHKIILKKLKKIMNQNNVEFEGIIFLPDWVSIKKNKRNIENVNLIKKLLNQLDIKYYDFYEIIKDKPLNYFASKKVNSHFNPAGYAKLANYIANIYNEKK